MLPNSERLKDTNRMTMCSTIECPKPLASRKAKKIHRSSTRNNRTIETRSPKNQFYLCGAVGKRLHRIPNTYNLEKHGNLPYMTKYWISVHPISLSPPLFLYISSGLGTLEGQNDTYRGVVGIEGELSGWKFGAKKLSCISMSSQHAGRLVE